MIRPAHRYTLYQSLQNSISPTPNNQRASNHRIEALHKNLVLRVFLPSTPFIRPRKTISIVPSNRQRPMYRQHRKRQGMAYLLVLDRDQNVKVRHFHRKYGIPKKNHKRIKNRSKSNPLARQDTTEHERTIRLAWLAGWLAAWRGGWLLPSVAHTTITVDSVLT